MCVLQTLLGKRAAGVKSSDLRHIVVAHTGHSSQLFPVATGRNAQFVATISAESSLAASQTTCDNREVKLASFARRGIQLTATFRQPWCSCRLLTCGAARATDACA